MDETKKLKLILGALMWFLVYMLVIGTVMIVNMFTGFTGHWDRLLDLGLCMGNVVAFGLSFYIMNRGMKMKMPWLVAMGVFVFLVNGWGIVRFFL